LEFRECPKSMVMADVLPRLLPDPLLWIQFGRVGWERNKGKTSRLSEVGTDEPSLMPGSSIPKDCDSFPRIPTPQVSEITNGCFLILPLTPHGMLFSVTKIDGSVKTDLFLSRIGLDSYIPAPRLPERSKGRLEKQRCFVLGKNDCSLPFQDFQFFFASMSHFLTASGFCSRYFFSGRWKENPDSYSRAR